jgi:hypothetical protein
MRFGHYLGPGGYAVRATTGAAGVAKTNSTQDILIWTAPNDGNLHPVSIHMAENVTSPETGGNLLLWVKDTTGTIQIEDNLLAASQSAGWFPIGTGAGTPSTVFGAVLLPGWSVTIYQSTALSGGATTVYAVITGA